MNGSRTLTLTGTVMLLFWTLLLGIALTVFFQLFAPGWPAIGQASLATNLALGLAVVLAVRKSGLRWREALGLRGFDRRMLAPLALILVGSVTVFSELYVVLQRLVPIPAVVEAELRQLLNLDGGPDTWITLIVAIGIAPFMEELLFRGALLRGLTRTRGVRSATLWTAAFFAFFHLYNPWQILPTFFLGLVLGWVVLTTGSVWAAVVVHAMFNAVSLAAFRFSSSIAEIASPGVPWAMIGVVVALIVGSLSLLVGLAWIEHATGGGPFSTGDRPHDASTDYAGAPY